MPNLVNRMIVREMTDEWQDASAMVVVSFGGLDVSRTEDLRGKLAEKGVRFRMVRNKLARRVLAERGVELDADALIGNTAIAWGDAEGTIGAAKVLAAPEVKKTKLVQFKAGLLEGEVLDAAGAAALADLPDRETLRAMMLGLISAPARGLACVVAGVPSATARVIQARADELEKAGG